MNIKVNTKQLLQALVNTERIVGKNVTLPILTTVLLETKKGKLKISATNLEMGEQFFINAKIEKEGEVAVPSRVFTNLVSSLQQETLTLNVSKDILTIKTDDVSTKILGMKTDEFPIIPTIDKDITIELPTQETKKAMMRVVDAVSLSEARPELTGVYMHCDNNKVVFAATDSFRLCEHVIETSKNKSGQYILPRASVLEMIKLFELGDLQTQITISSNQLGIEQENYRFVSRLIEGKYPDYKKIIPESHVSKIIIQRSELQKRVQMAGLFSSSIADVLLNGSKNSFGIESKNTDQGEYSTKIPATLEGEEFSLSVNFQYLLDGLKTFNSEEIHVAYAGEGAPLVLTSPQDIGATYVIMPLRT